MRASETAAWSPGSMNASAFGCAFTMPLHALKFCVGSGPVLSGPTSLMFGRCCWSTCFMPATRWSSTGRPGIGLPSTISPLASAGIFFSIVFASDAPSATLSLPTKVVTLLPGGGGVSTDTCGMPRATPCANGRTNRSGVVVIVAMPSFDVCIADWNIWTSCGPLIPFGAALLSLMPSTPAAALAPNAISWKAFWVVVAVIMASVTSLADFFWPLELLDLSLPPHAATAKARATAMTPASNAPRGERLKDDISTLPETRTRKGRIGAAGRSQREPRPLAAAATPQQAVERDRGEDHRAGRERAPVQRHVEVHEAAVDDAEQDGAEHGADDRRASAAQRRAADDRGGDGLQLEPGADVRVAGREEREAHHPGDPAEQAHEHERLDAHARDGDAGERGRLRVGADRPDAVTERGQAEDDGQDDPGDDQDPDRDRQAERGAAEGREERALGPRGGDLLAVAQREGDPAKNRRRGERGDDRGDRDDLDEHGLDEAHAAAEHDADRGGEPRVHPAAHEERRDDQRQAEDRADREIDLAHRDQERHARREDPDVDRLRQDVLDLAPREELGVQDPDRDREDDGGDEDAVGLEFEHPAAGAAERVERRALCYAGVVAGSVRLRPLARIPG